MVMYPDLVLVLYRVFRRWFAVADGGGRGGKVVAGFCVKCVCVGIGCVCVFAQNAKNDNPNL